MAIVQSMGALQRVDDRAPSAAVAPSRYSDQWSATYAAIYRTQPNVRTVVDYLARNIAQVALHVYRRVSDTDRVRLVDHELAQWLDTPNPDTTGYRLKENTFQDLGIYGMAYWLKVREPKRIGLVRVAPDTLTPIGWLLPSSYIWRKPTGEEVELAATDVCAFRYFNPDDPLTGLSPLETLRQILAADAVSVGFRRAFWQNAARLEGVIERPVNAPQWKPEQKQSFREQWAARYNGAPGQTAVLEDGMTFKATTYSAIDSEYTTARKLTREEVAAAFHVPLPMVGILDHATFSNIKEQHKHLYQDCLGPSFEMFTQEIERQLLVECDDRAHVYVEANIAEKLKGSFEEQALALRTAIGTPWMTVNEGRGRLNLPQDDDPASDEIARPLNMTTTALDAPSQQAIATGARVVPFRPLAALTPEMSADGLPIIRTTWARQRDALEKLPPKERAAAFDVNRWDRELARDLEAAYRARGASDAVAPHVAAALALAINAETQRLLKKGEEAFSLAREVALYVDDPSCS